jgi:hypothetical protein
MRVRVEIDHPLERLVGIALQSVSESIVVL